MGPSKISIGTNAHVHATKNVKALAVLSIFSSPSRSPSCPVSSLVCAQEASLRGLNQWTPWTWLPVGFGQWGALAGDQRVKLWCLFPCPCQVAVVHSGFLYGKPQLLPGGLLCNYQLSLWVLVITSSLGPSSPGGASPCCWP